MWKDRLHSSGSRKPSYCVREEWMGYQMFVCKGTIHSWSLAAGHWSPIVPDTLCFDTGISLPYTRALVYSSTATSTASAVAFPSRTVVFSGDWPAADNRFEAPPNAYPGSKKASRTLMHTSP